MFCTACGAENPADSAFCKQCGKALKADTSAPGTGFKPAAPPAVHQVQASARAAGSSGSDDIPEGVKGWSWGAFLLSWIWAIGNRTWVGLLALVPYVGFGVAIWLGIKGREMAWKNDKWDSVEHFNRVQKKWSQWGVGLIGGVFLLGILAAIAIPAYQDYVTRARASAELNASIEQAVEGTEASPVQQATAAPQASYSESGLIDSNADGLPSAVNTLAGQLARVTSADGERSLTLNGAPLFSGDDAPYQFPVRSFKLSNSREAVLMASSGGRGNSCETLFYFLVADGSGMKRSPLFGTCSAQGTFAQTDDTIIMTLPKMGGTSAIVFNGDVVTEDGQQLALNDENDPSK